MIATPAPLPVIHMLMALQHRTFRSMEMHPSGKYLLVLIGSASNKRLNRQLVPVILIDSTSLLIDILEAKKKVQKTLRGMLTVVIHLGRQQVGTNLQAVHII